MAEGHWPTKRCDEPKKHEPHQWLLAAGWYRNCPGRKVNRTQTRSVAI